MKRKLLISCFAAFLSLFPSLFCSFTYSAEEGVQKVHFAEEANWPPFTPNKFGIATEGLSLTLMQAIFSRLDMDVEIELLPQKRMLEYLKSGAKDGVSVMSINPERLQFLEFTKPLFQKKGYVYFLKDRGSPVEWDNYEDLQGFVIGIVSGHNYGEEFAQAMKKYNLETELLSHTRQGFDLLLAGRIDCYLCINLTANYFFAEPKYKGKISNAPKSYYQKNYHIGFSKKSDARFLIPRVNKVIHTMRSDGSLDKILAPYLE